MVTRICCLSLHCRRNGPSEEMVCNIGKGRLVTGASVLASDPGSGCS
jgi:hypothetical protein